MAQGGGMGSGRHKKRFLMPLRIGDGCIALIAVAVALRRN
jgi:hypothetical protein